MDSMEKALQTQLKNIEQKTGKTLADLIKIIQESGLEKFGQIRDMVKEKFQLGHGDANTLVHVARQAIDGSSAKSPADAVDTIYAGKHAELRPVHDAIMSKIEKLGSFEIAPKKTYLSLRRKKQFAMVGPGTKGRIEVGINMKGVQSTQRLEELPPGRMCQYRVFLTQPSEIDDELMGWIRTAFENAG